MGKKKEEEKLEEPSDEFMRAVCHSGTAVIDCELCGRTHVAINATGYDWYEDEKEDFEKRADAGEEMLVIHHNSDFLSYGHLEGKQAVRGCECHLARRFEDWVWFNRDMIMDYLRARIEGMVKDAEMEAKMVGITNRLRGRLEKAQEAVRP